MTTKILHIKCSPFAEKSVTRGLGDLLISSLNTKYANPSVVVRDLSAAPLPHLDAKMLAANYTPEGDRTPEQAALLAESNKAIAEIFAADTIVIEAPMWNFGIPSVLKAWIDHICVTGKTFKYTENGPVGLVPSNKKVIVISARGGIYSTGPAEGMDHQESYLKTVLSFIGLKTFEFIRAEGINMGSEAAATAKAAAKGQIETLIKNAA